MDTEFNAKITRVLQKFLEPDFTVKNDVYLNSLLKHLTENPETGCNMNCVNWDILNKQDIPTWLMEAVDRWEKLGKTPPQCILSFTLNLASFVCRDEQTFVMLNSHNVYERLIKLLGVNQSTTAPTIKLGYIRLISSLLEHKSGLQWIISTNYWAKVMCLSLKNQTIYITKEGYKFLARLLNKAIQINEMFCYNVVQLIMAPLSENSPCMTQNNVTNMMEVREQAIYQSLCSSLTLITEILEIFLENISEEKNLKVVLIFKERFNLEERIRSILLIAQNEDFVLDLYKILFILSFFQLYWNFGGKGKYIEYEKASSQSATNLYDVLNECVAKSSIRSIIKLSYLGYVYWKNIKCKMPVCVKYGDALPVLFENQMLLLQLYPIISVSIKLLGQKKALTVLDEDDVRDEFVDKICKNAIPLTIRIFFAWRNSMLINPYIFDHGTLALSYLMKAKEFFTRELGITAFQTLIYCLRDIINVLKEQPEQIMVLSKESHYMTQLLEAIAMFINEFNFTWRESLESICVMSMTFDFLSFPTWPTKLVVKGLQLFDISISKYMSPNMALLMDNVHDSSMGLIGPMLYAKLHDSSWEVRDTALEVLCIVSHNAKEKFPSFRKIVLDADLPSLTLKMSMNDGEAFVRATAVRCLQKMVQVSEFWTDLLKNGNVHEQAIQILRGETEGIVRSQAATLIATIFEHQEVPPITMSHFYDIMTHAATADLHWEVKVNALHFWEKVINLHLMHQGMIDGTFPKVTFSKEHRKIVTLNEPEVRKRLVKVLHQLSETGCLAVLIATLQDDCDIEVSKTATKITKDFVKLLKDYNVNTSNANISNPPSPLTPFCGVPSPPCYTTAIPSVSSDSQYHSLSPLSQLSQNSLNNSPPTGHIEDMADSILDEIINSQDMHLLQGVYNSTNQPSDNYLQLRYRQIVTPNAFLTFTYTNLESHANAKTKWMNGMDDFGSLLDDILKEYDNNDVNSMDCY